MNPLVSICIPTYEMNGKGKEYLEHSFQILASQTYSFFEVVISDHSCNSDIESLCNKWSDKLKIRHFFNEKNRGSSSANINNALKKAEGDVIKILFMDDYLFDSESLEVQLVHLLGNTNQWLVTACAHSADGVNVYRPHFPKYHDNIQYGENTISSPSVVMFKNTERVEFDEKLVWLMDTDFYKRMYDTFGLPSICNYITVVNREHPNQVSNTLATDEVRKSELEYISNKYPI